MRESGGSELVQYDNFVAPRTDGFQNFENNNYDCWPVLALICNLPPEVGFFGKNILPPGFINSSG